jgi:bacteriorhodopsin
VEYQAADDAGTGALWIVFVIMLAASGVFSVMAWNIPTSRRLYHVITTLIVVTAALSYFSMANGQAVANHCVETVYSRRNKEHPGETVEVCREVYYARYIDWALTTPLLLLDLCLLAGIDGAHTLMAIIADVIMVLTGLFAAFGNDESGTQKWGWYTIACFAYLVVIWHVSVHGQRMVRAKGGDTIKLFSSLAVFTFVLWTAYPM